MAGNRLLRRSSRDYWIAGVCGGLAEYFGLPATRLRVLYVIVSILSVAFPGILVYILMWLLIPRDETWE